MLETTVGEEVIRKGLTRYLNAHKYGNAVTDDLWQAIEEAWTDERTRQRERDLYNRNHTDNRVIYEEINMVAKNQGHAEHNFTVKEMMDTWTLQTGYPIISFIQLNDTNIYSIQQGRFLTAMSVSCLKSLETVVSTYSSSRSTTARLTIESRSKKLSIPRTITNG